MPGSATTRLFFLAFVYLPSVCFASEQIETSPGSVVDKQPQAFDLINKSTHLLGWEDPNPIALVRAVNHLHSLGKEQAIETLRAYVFRTRELKNRDDEEVDSVDQQRLCWIIPLLFVPSEEGAKVPSLGRFPQLDGASKEWNPFYITLKSDLPFHNQGFSGRRGPPDPDRGYLVEWAAEHGRLREKPLHPFDDPLKIADEICDKLLTPEEKSTPFGGQKTHIRQQAWNAIAHLVPEGKQKEVWSGWLLDDHWTLLKGHFQKMKVRWNKVEQNYVIEK